MIPIASKLGDVDMVRLRDRVLTAPVYAGTAGDYPWDRWEAVARAAGVPDELANLGRAMFREAFQHEWDDDLKVEAGWLDGGQLMIYHALAFPVEVEARWQHLMETDGDPFEVPPVETDPMELAKALKRAGIPVNVIFPDEDL